MSVSVSSLVALVFCTTPTTSVVASISKRCVGTGSGSAGTAGAFSASRLLPHFGPSVNSEQPVRNAPKVATSTSARSAERFFMGKL